jgi:hypothetical protein
MTVCPSSKAAPFSFSHCSILSNSHSAVSLWICLTLQVLRWLFALRTQVLMCSRKSTHFQFVQLYFYCKDGSDALNMSELKLKYHNGINVEIYIRNRTASSMDTWKLSDTFINDQWIKDWLSRGLKTHLTE